MEGAINSKTGEFILAWTIETNSSYQFPKEDIWFADSNEIESYDKEKVKDITKIEVKYRKGNDNVLNYNGTEYSISPCFYIPNKTELGINLIPETKEHKIAKNWIYNRIKNKNLSFIYSTVSRPFDYSNKINITELDVDYNKVGIEVSVKNNKVQRADIIIPLKNYSEMWGCGIVIEIQFSKQCSETTEKRSNDWAFKGYSICWLVDTDFENLSSEIIELKSDAIEVSPLNKILHEFSKNNLFNFKIKVQELSRMIDSKMKELNYPFCIGECKQCNAGYMTRKKIKRGENVGKFFYGCSNYFNGCRHSIFIEDDSD